MLLNIYEMSESVNSKLIQKLINRANNDSNKYENIVRQIVEEVKNNGDTALFEFTKKFDNVSITTENIQVKESEIKKAYSKVDLKILEVIRRAKTKIEYFHEKQKRNSWIDTDDLGNILGQKITPIEKTGVYVPGGKAVYPSSVLMNVIPAKVAGVKEIIMVTPPKKDGTIDPLILVAANEAGVSKIFKVGGAQAIAALAYGTANIPKVDKIVGPGNIFVALAKKAVFGQVNIDSVAGPSEILIIADEYAKAKYIAADMLSQAEHDEMAAAVLITTSKKLAVEVKKQLSIQVEKLSRTNIMKQSLNNNGAIIVVKNLEEAIDFSNKYAPEHLELCINNPFNWLAQIKNAGAIFLGSYSPEPLGDYMAGPNHVLPTGGTSKFFSPLGVDDFIKKSSIISYTQNGLKKYKEDIVLFAESEGLTAHANSLKVRFDYNE